MKVQNSAVRRTDDGRDVLDDNGSVLCKCDGKYESHTQNY